jgi:biopolymer transport protein ExbD
VFILSAAWFTSVSCAATPKPATECATCPLCPAPSAAASQTQIAPPQQTTVPVSLPSAGDFDVQAVLPVVLKATGELLVDNQVVAQQEDLKTLVRSAWNKNPNLRVVIYADRTASWEQVVRVMDLVRQQGAIRISFGVTALSQ